MADEETWERDGDRACPRCGGRTRVTVTREERTHDRRDTERTACANPDCDWPGETDVTGVSYPEPGCY